MAFGNQNGEFNGIPEQIPYVATVENVDNGASVDMAQTNSEDASNAATPPNKSDKNKNENKRVFGIFKRRTPEEIAKGESLVSIGYLIFCMFFELVIAGVFLFAFCLFIRHDLEHASVLWWQVCMIVLELAAIAQYVGSVIGLFIFLLVRTKRCKRLLKRVIWLWTLVLVLLGIAGLFISPYIGKERDPTCLFIALFSLLVPLVDFGGRYGFVPINHIILKD